MKYLNSRNKILSDKLKLMFYSKQHEAVKRQTKHGKIPYCIKQDTQPGWQNLPVSWKGKYHTLFCSTPWMTPLSRSTGTWRWVPEEWCPGCGSSLTYRTPRAAGMILPCRGSDPRRKQFYETQKIFSFSSWKKQTWKAERNWARWKKNKQTNHTRRWLCNLHIASMIYASFSSSYLVDYIFYQKRLFSQEEKHREKWNSIAEKVTKMHSITLPTSLFKTNFKEVRKLLPI